MVGPFHEHPIDLQNRKACVKVLGMSDFVLIIVLAGLAYLAVNALIHRVHPDPITRPVARRADGWRPGLDPRRTATAAQRRAVYRRYGHNCNYCGTHVSQVEMHMDHIIPWSQGGRTCVSNLQPLCEPCNLSKGTLPDHVARNRTYA